MTLTEAAFWTKRFGVIAVGGFVIFFIVVLILTIEPEPEVMPEYLTANFACTELREEFLQQRLEIPSLSTVESQDVRFEIATDTGKIDSLPNIINVYKFNNPTQSLTAQADAKIIARKMGFEPDAVIRRGTESYVWVNAETGKTLEIQAKNLNFTLKTDPSIASRLTREGTLPSEQEARSKATSALRSFGVSIDDYSSGVHRTTLININPDGSFRKAASLAEADLIRVDFTRNKSMITIPSNVVGAENMTQRLSRRMRTEPTEETKVVNDERISIYTFNTIVSFPETQRGNISVYIGPEAKDFGTGNVNFVYYIDYTFWPIYPESCGTYELVDPRIAIEKVQSGEGSLVYLYETRADDVVEYMSRRVKTFVIMDIFIVYYEGRDELEYLQPVYLVTGEAIFENDIKGTFDFFYPAVNYDIVQNRIYLPEPEVVEKKGFL